MCRNSFRPENILFASDYPHWDGQFPDAVSTLADRGDISEGLKRKIFFDNPQRFYGFELPAGIGEAAMIHHVSIPACEPRHVAEVLAELMRGKCHPFGPLEGAFMATSGDEHGSMIEVYPERATLEIRQ